CADVDHQAQSADRNIHRVRRPRLARAPDPSSAPYATHASTTEIVTAASMSDCAATYAASGMVCVTPGKLPAKVIVAPNSPRPRAAAIASPARRAGSAAGKVMRQKAYAGDARSVAAASS